MSDPNRIWKALIAAPAPEAKPVRTVAAIADKKAASVAMWEAIDKDDLELLTQALDAGASPTNRRTGRTALWEAIHRSQWANAELLRQRGFDIHCTNTSHKTLFGAIAGRDNVEEAERLLAWGCDPTKSDATHFLRDPQAPKLLEWWLEHGNQDKIPAAKNSNGDHLKHWVLIGANGSATLRSYLNARWHVDQNNPQGFVNHFYQAAEALWEHLADKDDVEMARACLVSGWGIPPSKYQGIQQSFGWRFTAKKAWKLLDWITQVPELHQEMLEDAKKRPRTTWWSTAADGVPAIERITQLGLDFAQKDEKGNTVAHEAMAAYKVSRAMVQWFIDNQRALLTQPNDSGVTPLEVIRDAKMKSQAQAMVMGKQAPASQEPSAPARRL